MRITATIWSILLAAVIGAMQGSQPRASGAVQTPDDVVIDDDDIGGVVTSSRGPEAGVWVIAETTSLPTKFARIVVTDDRGCYVMADLAEAGYEVWVRGYGLVDSARVRTEPGRHVALTAVIAPDARAAAQYYPAGYWFSLIHVPDKTEFPGTGANGISQNMKSQADWIRTMKSGTCWSCHALGTKATREIPAAFLKMPSMDAWQRRILSGQAGPNMMQGMTQLGMARALTMFSDWTDPIAAGELPPAPPPPPGIQPSGVITGGDWAHPQGYPHHQAATPPRNPPPTPNSLIY